MNMTEQKMYEPFVSSSKNKKYSVYVYKDGKRKLIHFGDTRYQHFKDSVRGHHYKHLDHNDMERRRKYLQRALKIKDGQGRLTNRLLHSPNYFSLKYLWSYIDERGVPMSQTYKPGYLYNEVPPNRPVLRRS